MHLIKKKATGKAVREECRRKKHMAARARSRLDELMFGMFNMGTAAVNGVNGIDHIDTLLRPRTAKSNDDIALQETKRTELPKS